MRIVFRVDVATHIGTGHFQRCKTLAKELLRLGHNVYFFSRKFDDHLICKMEEPDIPMYMIGCSSVDILQSKNDSLWLGVSQEEDAQNFLEYIEKLQILPDIVVVDHYSLDYEWEIIIKEALGSKILVIDDLANRKHRCDVLLDQNYYVGFETRYDNLVSKHTKLLLGPSYILLREEFLRLRTESCDQSSKKVLVNFGGIGCMEVWEKFIPALKATSDLYSYHVITGKLPIHQYYQIYNILSDTNIVCEETTNNMAYLMSESIFAIGACGSTVWERFCLGVNSCLIDLADNQVELINALSDRNLIDYLGRLQDISSDMIVSYLRNLFISSQIYLNRRQVIQELVDGMGGARVAAEMELMVGVYE